MSDALNKKQYDEMMVKLANLKNLAEQPGTAGEAAAAAAALQRLLFKYNLSIADVKQPEDHDYENPFYTVGAKYSSLWSRWQYNLLSNICRNNFCKMILLSWTKGVEIVGEPHNIAIVTVLYEYLRDECKRMMRADLRIAQEKGECGYNTDDWRYCYRQSFVSTIDARLREQQREDQTTYTGGSNLVVVKGQELANAVKELYPRLKANRSQGANAWSGSGSAAGREAGKRVNLNRSITRQGSSQLKLGA